MQVEVCFTCKKYVMVGQSYESKQRVNNFEDIHKNHPVQIVNENELGEEYEKEFK